MKRMAGMILAVLLIFLSGCSKPAAQHDMYLERAELTKEEENIVRLLKGESGGYLYDFKLDDTAATLQINVCELTDGEWTVISGGSQQFSDAAGRLALTFENLEDGIRAAVLSENSSGSSEYRTAPEQAFSGMRTTSVLEDKREITYETEIPLVIQICAAQSSIYTYAVDTWFQPEEYEKHGYEHVYAVTVRFSRDAM